LSCDGNKTKVVLTQDNNSNEEAREYSEENWKKMRVGLKDILER
jgi:hypothetical protein